MKVRSSIVLTLTAAMTFTIGIAPRANVEVYPTMGNVAAFDPLPPDVNSEVRTLGQSGERYLNGRSWHVGCPVPMSDLRVVMVRYIGFDGSDAQGPLIVHRNHAVKIARAMETLRANGFQIGQIRPVDEYDADDDKSTAANNTSAFNCRNAYGTNHWSQHAFGAAIDVNPVQNPYVPASGQVLDPDAERFVNRKSERNKATHGFIVHNGAAVKAFAAVGWRWGGVWSRTKDYQHFSSNGR